MGIIADNTKSNFTEIVPIFKYNSVQGRAYLVERTQGASGWESRDEHVPFPFRFVADMANLEVGHMAFDEKGPDFHMVKIADIESGAATMPERPSPDHRTGFSVRIYTKAVGLREWRGQSKCVLSVMDQLYDEYQKAPEAKKGMLPILEISDVRALKREGKFPGIDMQPVMKIAQWVARPEALVPATAAGAATNGHAAAEHTPATARQATHVPPPATHATAASAGDDEAEFA